MGTWQKQILRNRTRLNPARFARRPQIERLEGETTLFSWPGYTRARHRYFMFPVPKGHTEYGEYCGDNDAQLDRTGAFSHEASGGKYVPRTALFDLQPGVIGAARALPLGELFRP
jgi:hypothetical protein